MFLFASVEDSDEDLFENLYKKYRRSMFSVAYSVLKNSYDAEDALQNTFIKISTNMDKVKKVEPNSLGAYLAVVTKHCAIDYLRAKRNDLFAEEDKIEQIPDRHSLESLVLEKMDMQQVVSAIHNIKSPYKEALTLYYLFDHSYTAIAELTGRSTVAVRQQVSRGKIMLIKLLKGDENSEQKNQR